jgi:hypothetical protein
MLCIFNQGRGLSGDIIKKLLAASLNGLDLLNKLVNIDSIFLNPRPMRIHDLLANVPFACRS